MNYLKKYSAVFFSLFFILILFTVTYSYDNKYTTKGPYGKDGEISITEEDIEKKQMFLIDGWQLYWGEYTPLTINDASLVQYTFIGEYSNYPKSIDHATYRLNINYSGEDKAVQIFFPQLNKNAKIYFDGKRIAQDEYDTLVSTSLEAGKHELIVSVERSGFYNGGMYFVPTIGTSSHVFNQMNIQNVLYMMLMSISIVIAFFAYGAYRKKDAKVYLMNCLTSLSFAAYVSYHLIYALEFMLQDIAYIIQNISFYLMVFFLFQLLFELCNLGNLKAYKKVLQPVNTIMIVASLILFAMIPYSYECILYHSKLQEIYRIYIAVIFIVLGIYYVYQQSDENKFVVLGTINFAAGLLINIVDSNLFEPIYTFWQFEWCGFILMMTLGRLIYVRYRKVNEEIIEYEEHFDDIVEVRTKKVNQVLEERKEFYAHVAHDLKSPISASHTYIETLKANHPDIEDEYLAGLENKLNEMFERIAKLNAISGMDKFTTITQISMNAFLDKVKEVYEPDAQALGIHFNVDKLKQDVYFKGQQDKLMIVFENIIFNAFDALSLNGHIAIHVEVIDKDIVIRIEDDGKGMSEEQLIHIFDKFYTSGKGDKGSGMGLFIARNIIMEMNGELEVHSQLNKGSCFIIKLELAK